MWLTGDTQKLSEQLLTGLTDFGKFIEADAINYKDLGISEELTIQKKGNTFKIKSCGSRVDGGFFTYDNVANPETKLSEEEFIGNLKEINVELYCACKHSRMKLPDIVEDFALYVFKNNIKESPAVKNLRYVLQQYIDKGFMAW